MMVLAGAAARRAAGRTRRGWCLRGAFHVRISQEIPKESCEASGGFASASSVRSGMFIVETEKMGKAPSGRHVRDSMSLLTELWIFRGSVSINMPPRWGFSHLLGSYYRHGAPDGALLIAKRGIFSNRHAFRLVFKTCNRISGEIMPWLDYANFCRWIARNGSQKTDRFFM